MGEIKSINLMEADLNDTNKVISETSPQGLNSYMGPVDYSKHFGSQTITAGFYK